MKIIQSRSFSRKVKKLNKKEKSVLDKQIRAILSAPDISDHKKGDLRGVFVHKFKIKTKQYLQAYRIVDENLQL
ncbi:type II toxin-antitoxin system RelE/ParE family toxin [Desulfococcaceae bacterium HSG9]|nr:type II toxin-antitoxin system RelE/ParE family toxin [Desulfococcaceae bacterium HSG9]